jgi:hypothetical protein
MTRASEFAKAADANPGIVVSRQARLPTDSAVQHRVLGRRGDDLGKELVAHGDGKKRRHTLVAAAGSFGIPRPAFPSAANKPTSSAEHRTVLRDGPTAVSSSSASRQPPATSRHGNPKSRLLLFHRRGIVTGDVSDSC